MNDRIDSSDAGRWTDEHGFTDGEAWWAWDNGDEVRLDELLREQPDVKQQEVAIRFEAGNVSTHRVWRFPDGSGVVEIGAFWDLMGPDGEMEYAEIVEVR